MKEKFIFTTAGLCVNGDCDCFLYEGKEIEGDSLPPIHSGPFPCSCVATISNHCSDCSRFRHSKEHNRDGCYMNKKWFFDGLNKFHECAYFKVRRFWHRWKA